MKDMLISLVFKGRRDPSIKRASDGVVASQTRVSRAVAGAQSQFAKHRKAAKYGQVLATLKASAFAAGEESEEMAARIATAERRFEAARRDALGYSRALEDTKSNIKATAEAEAQAIRKRAELFRDAKRTASLAVAAGGAFALRAGLKEAQSERFLSTVISARDGDNSVEGRRAAANRFTKRARAFARDRDTTANASELIEAGTIISGTGLNEEVALAGAKFAQMLSKTANGTTQETARIMASMYKNFGEEMEGSAEAQVEQIGNVLASVQNRFKFDNFNQLGAGLKEASASAKQYRVSLSDTATMMGVLNNSGVESGRAGTAVNAVLRNLKKGTDEYGTAMVRQADGQLDVIATLRGLKGALDGLPLDERAQALQKTFGDEGMKGIGPLLDQIDALEAGIKGTRDAVGGSFLKDTYFEQNTRELTIFNSLMTQSGQIATGVGKAMLPVVSALLAPVDIFLRSVAWGVDHIPLFGEAIGFTAGAFLAYIGYTKAAALYTTLFGHSLTLAISYNVIGRVSLLGTAMGRIPSRLLASASAMRVMSVTALPGLIAGFAGLALAMWPVTVVVTAVAVAGLLLFKYWKPIKAFFGGFWASVGPNVKAFSNWARSVLKWVPGFRIVAAIFRLVGRAVSGFLSLFKPVQGEFGGASEAGERFGNGVKRWFKATPLMQFIGWIKTALSWIETMKAKMDGLVARAAALPGPAGAFARSLVVSRSSALQGTDSVLPEPANDRGPAVTGGRAADRLRRPGPRLATQGGSTVESPATAFGSSLPTGAASGSGAGGLHIHAPLTVNVEGVTDAEGLRAVLQPVLNDHVDEIRRAALHGGNRR